MDQYIKPLPLMSPWGKGFWEGCKEHQLLMQKCGDCGAYRHYPRPMCPECHSTEATWAPVKPRGEVYSMTIVHRSILPGFEIPYAVVIVELEEGMRMMGDVVDAKPDDIYIGMPVEVIFDDVTEEVTIPRFKKAV